MSPAVDGQQNARAEGGALAREEERRLRDLLRRAHPTERVRALAVLQELLTHTHSRLD